MMKSLLLVILSVWSVTFAQKNNLSPVSYQPMKPVANTKVLVTYNPTSPKARLKNARALEMVEFRYGKPFEVYPMALVKGKWQASYIVTEGTMYVVFGFRNGDQADDNEGHLWDFLVHDKTGKPLRNAHYMRAFSYAERNYDTDTARTLKNKDLTAEVTAYPDNLIVQTMLLKEAIPNEGETQIMAKARTIAERSWQEAASKTEVYAGLSFMWRQLNKPNEIEALKTKALQENPTGELAIRLTLQTLLETKGTSCDKLNAFLQEHGEQVVPKDYRLYNVFNQYKACKDREKMVFWANKYAAYSEGMASYSNRTLATAFMESGFAPEAEEFIRKAIAAEPQELFRAYMKRGEDGTWLPTSLAGDKLALARTDLNAGNLKVAGRIFLAVQKNEAAYDALNTARKTLQDDKEVAILFATAAEALARNQEAYEVYWHWATKDRTDQQALDGLARSYAKLNAGTEGWAAVLSKLEGIWGKKPEPRFTVADYDPKRDPTKDLEETLAQARAEQKQVMLFVGGQWCSWCHALTRYFKQNEKVAQILHDRYLIMKVNFSEENENVTFLSKYPAISGYPHLFFLSADGKLLHSQNTGEIEAGVGMAYDEPKVLEMLEKWAGR